MPKPRRQPRVATKVWTPADYQPFERYNRISVIDTVPGHGARLREQEPEFWVYYDSLPPSARAAFDQAPNGPSAALLWQAILEKYPYNRETGKWAGAK